MKINKKEKNKKLIIKIMTFLKNVFIKIIQKNNNKNQDQIIVIIIFFKLKGYQKIKHFISQSYNNFNKIKVIKILWI